MIKPLVLSLIFASVLSGFLLVQTFLRLNQDPQAGIGFVLLPIYFFIVFGVAFAGLLIVQKIRQ